MYNVISQPIIKQAVVRNVKNVALLGTIASAMIFTNNAFREQGKATIQCASNDFSIIKTVVKEHKNL